VNATLRFSAENIQNSKLPLGLAATIITVEVRDQREKLMPTSECTDCEAFGPIRVNISAKISAPLATQPWPERRQGHPVGISTHVDDSVMVAGSAETPRIKSAHAIGVHVSKCHWRPW